MKIFEAVLDDLNSNDASNVVNKLIKSTTDNLKEYAESYSELLITPLTLAFRVRMDIVLTADNQELKKLLCLGADIYSHILNNATFIAEHSKVFPQASFELEGFDKEPTYASEDVIQLTASFKLADYTQPKDIAKLIFVLLRNFIMFEDAHPDELSTVDVALVRITKGNFVSVEDSIDEQDFEGHIDNGLNYEDENAFYFMNSLMNMIHVIFKDFSTFDGEDWQRQYVNGQYDVPFYIWLDKYLKREHFRWKR